MSSDGTLERRFQDELDKLSPLALIFDAVPTPWPPTEEFVRRAADLSRDWPFARDFTWWWLTLFGKKDRYQPCFQSLWLDILRNAEQSTNDLLQKMLKGKLGDAFLVEFLANIAPNRVLKPDFRQEFFDNISATFNSSEIGIVFNSYQPGSCEGTRGPSSTSTSTKSREKNSAANTGHQQATGLIRNTRGSPPMRSEAPSGCTCTASTTPRNASMAPTTGK